MQKSIIYTPIPEFDQMTQAIFQLEPVDMGDYVEIGVEIRDVEFTDGVQEGDW